MTVMLLQVMSTEEVKNNVDFLAQLHANLEEAQEELAELNNAEVLLGWEKTTFPILREMFTMKEPYEKLWNTVKLFNEKNEKWKNGEEGKGEVCVRGRGCLWESWRGGEKGWEVGVRMTKAWVIEWREEGEG